MLYYMQYVADKFDNKVCIKDVFKYLKKIIIDDRGNLPPIELDTAKKQIIIQCIAHHIHVPEIVSYGLQLLGSQLLNG